MPRFPVNDRSANFTKSNQTYSTYPPRQHSYSCSPTHHPLSSPPLPSQEPNRSPITSPGTNTHPRTDLVSTHTSDPLPLNCRIKIITLIWQFPQEIALAGSEIAVQVWSAVCLPLRAREVHGVRGGIHVHGLER